MYHNMGIYQPPACFVSLWQTLFGRIYQLLQPLKKTLWLFILLHMTRGAGTDQGCWIRTKTITKAKAQTCSQRKEQRQFYNGENLA